MAAPKKPNKTEQLRRSRQKPAESDVNGSESEAEDVDYTQYRKAETVTVSARLEPADRDTLDRYAQERGLKTAQVVRSWILERMRSEGLR